MALSRSQETQLLKIVEQIQAIVAEAKNIPEKPAGTRVRRSGKDLVDLKKAIKKERKAGASVSELAEKYGITKSYIYQLGD